MPADAWQILLIIGVICIFVSPHMPWWPSELLTENAFSNSSIAQSRLTVLKTLIILLRWPVVFAGIAGYFVCFWPGKTPVRRTLAAVVLPGLLTVAGTLRLYFFFAGPGPSVIYSRQSDSFFLWLQSNVFRLPFGLLSCALGIAFVLIFATKVLLGASSFPVLLASENATGTADDAVSWERTRRLIFFLIGPLFLVFTLINLVVIGLPYLALPRISLSALTNTSSVLSASASVALAISILGSKTTDTFRRLFRVPDLGSLMIAFLLPVTATFAAPAAHYVFDRVQWAAHSFGKYSPPQPSQYFDLSNVWHLWVFLLIFVAAAEEIVFRGLLLPRLVERYGLHQGIFLVGMIWTAIHFGSDRYSGDSPTAVLVGLASRILLCMTLNCILSWMTLRQGSVVSALVTHWVWNQFNVVSRTGESFPGEQWVSYCLLGIIAYVLLRFWPISQIKEQEVPETAANAGPSEA